MKNSTELEASAGLGSVIGRIAVLLNSGGVLSAGDVSSLRRMDPRHPAAAFFKIEGAALDNQLPGDSTALAEQETRWAAIVCGLAHLGALHQPGIRLGRVLAEAGYSDLRFVRVVRADTDRLIDDLPSLARFLAAKRAPVDWTGAAQLILSAGGPREEIVRRNIARDFYGSLGRLEAASR